MKRYGNLWKHIITYENCKLAIENAARGKHDRREVINVTRFDDQYAKKLSLILKLHKFLYKVSPYKFVKINDNSKERELAKLPFFPDKVIQWAIMLIMEPYFMKIFLPHTCASIKGRGISYLQKLMNKYIKEKTSVLSKNRC